MSRYSRESSHLGDNEQMSDTRGPGRPRSQRARQAVLRATTDLLATLGYEALTIDAIAERAGVGRQTIYRWWPSKASIIAEAVVDGTIAPFESLADGLDLRSMLHAWVAAMQIPTNATLVRALSAAASSDSADAEALYHHGTGPSHAALTSAVRAAQDEGRVRSDLNPDALADSLTGAILYRVLARIPLPPDYADDLLAPLLMPR